MKKQEQQLQEVEAKWDELRQQSTEDLLALLILDTRDLKDLGEDTRGMLQLVAITSGIAAIGIVLVVLALATGFTIEPA